MESLPDMKEGDVFTVEGFGFSKDGELIWDGINVKRRIPQKVHELKKFKVQKFYDNGNISLGKPFSKEYALNRKNVIE